MVATKIGVLIVKILLAIEGKNHKKIADKALRFCGRTGYELRIFCKREKRSKFIEAIKDANYHWYLALREDQVITKIDPHTYARQNGFDLILFVPDSLNEWRKNSAMKEWELKPMVKAIGSARVEFGKKSDLWTKHFKNGAIMVRV